MEIEAKYKVQDHDAVSQRLAVLEARWVGVYSETNHIFDQPQIGLRQSGRALRVRELVTLEGEQRQSTITFKGPRDAHAVFKSRPEIEIEIDATAALTAVAMFESMGFVRNLVFQKIRQSYVHRNVHIELDALPHLGRFVEIEGPDEASITSMSDQLGLETAQHLKHSYVSMLLKYCAAAGIDDRIVEFEDE